MTHAEKRLGLMFTLVGPGGVGKNALMNQVIEETTNLCQLPTATTRPMRPNEQQGREHLFVSHEKFRQMIADGALIEWQEVHKGHLYGVPRATVETAIKASEDLIADIDIYGATILRNTYPDNVVLIFIAPPSLDVLEKRMRDRGTNEKDIRQRVQRAAIEMPYAPTCDYLIVNDQMEAAAEMLKAVVLAEHSRRDLMNLRVESQLPRQRIDFAASVIVVNNGQVLYRESLPHFSISRLMPGEVPHEAGLRVLAEDMDIKPVISGLGSETSEDCRFVRPVTVENISHDFFQQIAFVYLYIPESRIPVGDGWAWIPYADAGLSQPILDALAALSDQDTGR